MGFVSSLPPLPLAPPLLLVLLLCCLLLLSSSWSLSSIFVHANVCVIAHHFVVAFFLLLLFFFSFSFISEHSHFAVVICMIIIVIITATTIGLGQTEWRWSVHLVVCGIFFILVYLHWCWYHTLRADTHTQRQTELHSIRIYRFYCGFLFSTNGTRARNFCYFFYRFVSLLVFVLYFISFFLSSVEPCVIRIYVSTCAASCIFCTHKSVPTICALCRVVCRCCRRRHCRLCRNSDCVDVRLRVWLSFGFWS